MKMCGWLSALLLCGQNMAAFADTVNDADLQQRFMARHEKMIPVVAVADMFFACNRATKSDNYDHQLDDLIKDMDRDVLATKLLTCLDGNSIQSDVALNYGLVGCFHSQMKHLAQPQYDEKMTQMIQLLPTLSREDRQKSFTQCVSDQAIYYVKQ